MIQVFDENTQTQKLEVSEITKFDAYYCYQSNQLPCKLLTGTKNTEGKEQ